MASRKPVVYFAGKVVEDVPDPYGDRIVTRDVEYGNSYPRNRGYPADSEGAVLVDRRAYVTSGPLTIDDKHGSGFGVAAHGCEGSEGKGSCTWLGPGRDVIMRRCLKQIDASDAVVLTPDAALSCYASLAECGYAMARQKVIVLRLHRVPEDAWVDLWFFAQMSKESVRRAPDLARSVLLALGVPPTWDNGDGLHSYVEALDDILARRTTPDPSTAQIFFEEVAKRATQGR